MSLPGNKAISTFEFSLLNRSLACLCFLMCLWQLFNTTTEKSGERGPGLVGPTATCPFCTAFFYLWPLLRDHSGFKPSEFHPKSKLVFAKLFQQVTSGVFLLLFWGVVFQKHEEHYQASFPLTQYYLADNSAWACYCIWKHFPLFGSRGEIIVFVHVFFFTVK